MVWVDIKQRFDDGLFGSTIHFADIIGIGFFGDGEMAEIVGGTVDQIAGATRGFHRDVEHGMHGCLKFNERSECSGGVF